MSHDSSTGAGTDFFPVGPEYTATEHQAQDQPSPSDIIQVETEHHSDSQLSSPITNLDELKSEILVENIGARAANRDTAHVPDSSALPPVVLNSLNGDTAAESADSPESDRHNISTTSAISSVDGSAAILHGASAHNFYNTIRMNVADRVANAPGSSDRTKQYQLEDGTVVSGKGLGRGRPGVKRGPRKGSANALGSGDSTPGLTPRSVSDTTAAGSKPFVKRRRSLANGSKPKKEADIDSDSLSESRESTPEYNPTDETRSGRKIQKPPVPQPSVSASASPAAKRPKIESRNTNSASSPALKTHPKIKRRLYKGREQLALCEHCQRGHGPHGNAIVFCDACNKCWHQRCHDPHVPQSTVADSKAEWFCANCEKILHGKKGKKGAKAGDATATPAKPVAPQFVGPLVGGAALTQAHKIAFLESRTKEQLISLILQGSDLAPALPMFQMPAPQLPQAQFKSNYVTPISSTPGLHNGVAAEAEDEGYDSYFDDHAALYPKPGQGVKLPPDSTDLHMLLEHPQSRTFSHWIRGMPTREYSGNADVVFQRQQ